MVSHTHPLSLRHPHLLRNKCAHAAGGVVRGGQREHHCNMQRHPPLWRRKRIRTRKIAPLPGTVLKKRGPLQSRLLCPPLATPHRDEPFGSICFPRQFCDHQIWVPRLRPLDPPHIFVDRDARGGGNPVKCSTESRMVPSSRKLGGPCMSLDLTVPTGLCPEMLASENNTTQDGEGEGDAALDGVFPAVTWA